MTQVGGRLQLRLFLEGVEVPVIAATVTSQKNAAAVASLQIPANDYVLDFKPRTLVHLFCFDGVRGEPADNQVWVGGAGIDVKQRILKDPAKGGLVPGVAAPPPNPRAAMEDLENDNYKLIFGGEVMGIYYSKTPQSRSMTLQCVDWSSYWDLAMQYQVSGLSFGDDRLQAMFTGASTTLFREFLDKNGDIVFRLLNTAPRSYPNMKGTLLGGLMHIIESVGGVYFGKDAVRGSNDFFSLAEMRLHLTQMIGANRRSKLDEVRLLKANGFDTLFSKTLGDLGEMVSIRDILLALQPYIFHEVVPINAPRFVPPEGDPNTKDREVVALAADPETLPLARAATTLKDKAFALKGRVEKQFFEPPAKANATSATQEEKGTGKGGLYQELSDTASVAEEARKTARTVSVKTGDSALLNVAAAFETVGTRCMDILAICQVKANGTWVLPAADTNDARQVVSILNSVMTMMQTVLDANHTRDSKLANARSDPPARLLTQIYRPDVWMCSPPRCNVLFPENYSQFSFGRNFGSEVSRILLRTHEALWDSDYMFDGAYMAPSRLLGVRGNKAIAAGRTNKEPPDLVDAPATIVKDMMDHELYTGIQPMFERMSDLNLHALRGGLEINGAQVGFAQLACNHLFFQFRFKSRELMASGKFNMYSVLGFPMLIVDKYTTDDALRGEYDSATAKKLATTFSNLPPAETANMKEIQAAKISDLAEILGTERENTHYLGTPTVISHSLSAQSGGSTQWQMDYARVTNEKTEFFGDNLVKTDTATLKKKANIPTIVAALDAPKVGTKGPLGGKITKVKDVTDLYQNKLPKAPKPGATSDRFGSATLLPLFVSAQGFSGRKPRATRVPVGVQVAATNLGPEVVALVGSAGSSIAGDGSVLVTFRAFRVIEELGVYEAEKTQLPAEDITFPPWYGEHWRSKNIGAMYSDFFGVGAITDQTGVLAPNAAQKFGDALSQALVQQFEASFGPNDEPPPGMPSVPSAPGGGTLKGIVDKGVEQVGEIDQGSTIAAAVSELVRIYSATRTQHYDTAQFVWNYTWRPIASIVDLFGSADLRITDKGEVTAGREGFHSRAFGDFDDLRQLVNGGDGAPQEILGLSNSPEELASDRQSADKEIAKRLDTRKEKRLAVMRYLTALAASRGVLLG